MSKYLAMRLIEDTNNTTSQARLEPRALDPESNALTTRPPRLPNIFTEKRKVAFQEIGCVYLCSQRWTTMDPLGYSSLTSRVRWSKFNRYCPCGFSNSTVAWNTLAPCAGSTPQSFTFTNRHTGEVVGWFSEGRGDLSDASVPEPLTPFVCK